MSSRVQWSVLRRGNLSTHWCVHIRDHICHFACLGILTKNAFSFSSLVPFPLVHTWQTSSLLVVHATTAHVTMHQENASATPCLEGSGATLPPVSDACAVTGTIA